MLKTLLGLSVYLTLIVFLSVFIGRPWIRWRPKSVKFIAQTVRDPVRWQAFRKEIFREYIVVALTGIALELATTYWQSSYFFLVRVVGPHRTQTILGLLVIIFGVAAHYFKRLNQSAYGIVEVGIGAASGFAVALGLAPDHIALSQWASLIGCAYVVARGLNNVQDAHLKKATSI